MTTSTSLNDPPVVSWFTWVGLPSLSWRQISAPEVLNRCLAWDWWSVIVHPVLSLTRSTVIPSGAS